MPFTVITKPTVGDPTRKSTIDAVIDNLSHFNTEIAKLGGTSLIKNGSLETVTSGVPDAWARTLLTGGSAAVTGNGQPDTDCVHGGKAFKFTSPGGAGNGGGYLETLDFISVSPNRPLTVSWQWRSTASTTANVVEVLWYTSAQSLISTVTVANISTAMPSAWRQEFQVMIPPATARFCKLRFTGCSTASTTAGSTYFDDIYMSESDLAFRQSVEFEGTGTSSTSYSWTAPTGVTIVRVTAFGGGGGGGAGHGGGGGGGGGSGEMVQSVFTVVPGTSYAISVGGGGASGASGQDSTWETTGVVATAGSPGGSGGGSAGGAGGTGGTGMRKIDGNTGETGTGSLGGRGGNSISGLAGGRSRTTGGAGNAIIGSKPRGAGGAGGFNSGNAGGAGGAGSVIVEW